MTISGDKNLALVARSGDRATTSGGWPTAARWLKGNKIGGSALLRRRRRILGRRVRSEIAIRRLAAGKIARQVGTSGTDRRIARTIEDNQGTVCAVGDSSAALLRRW